MTSKNTQRKKRLDNVCVKHHNKAGKRDIADGGRLVKTRAEMSFSATPDRPLTVVARFTVGLPVRLALELGGREFPVHIEDTAHDTWSEVKVEVPAALVRRDNRLVVASKNGAAFHAYHFFFYQ